MTYGSNNNSAAFPNSMLLLQATVIHALHLNADLFSQAVERVVGADAARTMGGMTVLVRVKAHGARLLGQVFFQ